MKRVAVAPAVLHCDAESLRRQFLQGNFIAPSTMLVRRDLLLQIGLFDTALSHMEDRDCWLRLLAVSTMAVVERFLANPTKYPPGTAELYRKTRHLWHLGAGRFAEERGDLKQARRYCLQAWRFGGGPLPVALAVLCSLLPAPVRHVIRALGRRLHPSPARPAHRRPEVPVVSKGAAR